MIRSDLYYGVQFVQSLYLLLWQSERIHEIPECVFSVREDVSVCYDGMEKFIGREAVRSFYRDMAEQTKKKGGFFRMDMPTTQFIEPSADGSSAVGHWTTMTRVLQGTVPVGDIELCIGQFTNEYVLEDRIWKLKQVKWEQLWKAAAWKITPDMHLESYAREPKEWIKEVPKLTELSMEGVTSKTRETLALRNEIYSWFYRFNVDRDSMWKELCISREDKESIRQMLQSCRYVLTTSPVLHMNDDLSCGEAFYSVSLLKDGELGYVTYTRGAIHMKLRKEASIWKIDAFGWYPYATLDPWKTISE